MTSFREVSSTELAAVAAHYLDEEGARIAAEMERRAAAKSRIVGFVLGSLFTFFVIWRLS